jgi:hypothetical protein
MKGFFGLIAFFFVFGDGADKLVNVGPVAFPKFIAFAVFYGEMKNYFTPLVWKNSVYWASIF